MKKGILMLLAVVLLASCGDTVKKVPYEEKEAMVEKAQTDTAVKQELEKIMKELKEKSDKGNKEANIEFQEYLKIESMQKPKAVKNPVSI
ncbi:hypothetical protein [Fusobacterium sp.]|uniref:hypothetical protein n=1 Tax=Fusobacterium sp. TaxID=68766 RepID=UPI002900BEBF|nr:hypothetical protein [Fusobacterium sp.]MDU1912671.1 hypothetical protein [Fusobacterium sp.]